MRILLQSTVLCACLCATAQAGEITLTVSSGEGRGATKLTDEVVINANETAQVKSCYGAASDGNSGLRVIKNGITNSLNPMIIYDYGYPVTVAGPATIRLEAGATGGSVWFCTVNIKPESFPPGQTIILPVGTVGVIYVESSTNLIQWQDEWTHTFSNTNQNRFFRLRAERSLP